MTFLKQKQYVGSRLTVSKKKLSRPDASSVGTNMDLTKVYKFSVYDTSKEADNICEMSVNDAYEKLVIVGTCLIFQKDLEKFQKKWPLPEEAATLYNLLNYEFIKDAPKECWEWFKNEMKLRKKHLNKEPHVDVMVATWAML